MNRLISRIATIGGIAILSACSSGGINSHPPVSGPPSTPTPANAIGSIAIKQAGSITSGNAGSFAISIIAYGSSGAQLTGTYPIPVTLVSSTNHLTLSSSQVTTANQTVTVTYDGTAFAGNAAITATDGTIQTQLPVVSGSGSSGTTTIASLSLDGVSGIQTYGAQYVSNTESGVFAISLTAYDANGNPITGTYNAPVVITPSSAAVTFEQGGTTGPTASVTSGGAANIIGFYTVGSGTTFAGTTLTATVGDITTSYTIP